MLPENSTINDTYIVLGTLNSGSFSICYKVLDEHNVKWACKIISKLGMTKHIRSLLMDEIAVHKTMDHPNIVKFKESFEDDDNFYIVTELCKCDLFDSLVKKVFKSEADIKPIILELLEALKYLKEQKVVHADIKPENIFLTKDFKVKLGDFGFARRLEDGEEFLYGKVGTFNYISPEILTSSKYTYTADIWSLGTIIYVSNVRIPPFQSATVGETRRKVIECEYTYPDSLQVSPELIDLVDKILRIDPVNRISLEDIKNHEWFN